MQRGASNDDLLRLDEGMEQHTSEGGDQDQSQLVSWQENLRAARVNSGTFPDDVTEVTSLQKHLRCPSIHKKLKVPHKRSHTVSQISSSGEFVDSESAEEALDASVLLAEEDSPPDQWSVAKTRPIQCPFPLEDESSLDAPRRANSAQAIVDRLDSYSIPSDSAHVVAGNSVVVEEMARFRRRIIEQQSIRRGPPDWLWAILLIGVVVGGLGYVYIEAARTTKIASDPTFEAKIKRLERARASLDEGHRLALLGPRRAMDAVKAYSAALALEPTLGAAERGLGVAYTALGEPDKAIKHFRKYLSLSPDAKDRKEVKQLIEFMTRVRGRKKNR